jgi:hypothetical protein
MNYISNIVRSEGDPKIISTGPSSANGWDSLGRALGWFSLGLGILEVLAPRRITRALGVEGNEALVRAYGAREIGSAMLTLSTEKTTGLWARVAGDGLDVVSLAAAYTSRNPKRENVGLAIAAVVGVAALDLIGLWSTISRHGQPTSGWRSYNDRSGFPQGIEKARGAAMAKVAEKATA